MDITYNILTLAMIVSTQLLNMKLGSETIFITQ